MTSISMLNRVYLKNSVIIEYNRSNLANTYVNNYRPSKYVMKKRGILKRLRGTMNRDVYITKIFEIITTLLKKRLWHRCFPVNFASFLRSFLQNSCGGCFCQSQIFWRIWFPISFSNLFAFDSLLHT